MIKILVSGFVFSTYLNLLEDHCSKPVRKEKKISDRMLLSRPRKYQYAILAHTILVVVVVIVVAHHNISVHASCQFMK